MEPDRRPDEAVTDQSVRRSVSGRRTSRAADVLPLDRFNAFTDGVFAIAITLLVLELSVPAVDGRLLPALAEQWQEFLGYLISFVFIGGIWVSHAGMTKLMRHADTLAYGIDLLVLLFVGVLPFSTNLLVTHLSGPDVEAAVVIYGVNVLLASLALSLLMFYIASERSLVVDGVADETFEAKVRQRWILIAPECRCHRPGRRGTARCRRGVSGHDVPRAGPPADPPSSASALGRGRPRQHGPLANRPGGAAEDGLSRTKSRTSPLVATMVTDGYTCNHPSPVMRSAWPVDVGRNGHLGNGTEGVRADWGRHGSSRPCGRRAGWVSPTISRGLPAHWRAYDGSAARRRPDGSDGGV